MTAIQQSLISGHHSQNRNEGESSHANATAINNSTESVNTSTVNISYQAVMRLSAYEQQRSLQDEMLRGQSDPLAQELFTTQALKSAAEPAKPDNQPVRKFQEQERAYVQKQGLKQSFSENNPVESDLSNINFPENIVGMLAEIKQNIVQTSEPGYKHLLNLLINRSDSLSQPQQLEDVIRKETFFLGRRKAFMDSSEYQSYSQVLSQFSNIMQREFTL